MKYAMMKKISLFALTFASVLSLSSCNVISDSVAQTPIAKEEGSYRNGETCLSGEKLLEAVKRQTENGIVLSNVNFSFVAPVKAMNEQYVDQTIAIQSDMFSLRLPSSNSEDSLKFEASLQVMYNQESIVAIDTNYWNNNLYFSITDVETEGQKYDLKYKIEIESGSSVDEFSQLIDHIFDLVNKYGSVVSNFSSLLPSVDLSKNSSQTIEQAKTSLSLMEGQLGEDGSYHYCLTIKSDSFSLPVFLNSDSEGNLLSISIHGEKDDYVDLNNSSHPNRISFCSSISPLESGHSFKDLSGEDSSYSRLVNVTGLLNQIYPLAKTPRFSVEGKINLSHIVSNNQNDSEEDAIKSQVKEEATLDLSLKADISNVYSSNGIKIASDSMPNALNAGFTLVVDPGKEKQVTKKLDLDFVRESKDDVYLDKGYAYLTTQALRTKMDFFTLDAMIGKIIDLANVGSSSTSLRGSFTEEKVNSVKDVLHGLFGKFKLIDTIDAILNDFLSVTSSSSALSGIENGQYEKMLSLIHSIKRGVKNIDGKNVSTIDLVFDAKAIALSGGTITISILDGSINRLLGIVFSDLTFGTISIDGNISLINEAENIDFEINKPSEEGRAYLRRLPDIFDRLVTFGEEKHASVSLSGYVKSLDSANPDGFYIEESSNSKITFDLENRKGTGQIVFKDIKGKNSAGEEINQNYRLGIDILDNAWENNHRVSNANNLFFMVNTPESGAAPLQGRFTMDSLQGMLSLLLAFTKTKDERFTKYVDWFSNAESSSILLRVLKNNEINPLLSASVLKSFVLNESKKTATAILNGATLSLDGDVTLEIAYSGDYYALERDEKFENNDSRTRGAIESIRILTQTGNQDINLLIKFDKSYVEPGRKNGSSFNWNAYQYGDFAANGSTINDDKGEYAKHDINKYKDWSSLQFLLQYILNSAILGNDETYQFGDDNSVNAVEKAKGSSTYHIKDESGIKLSASLGSLELKSFTLNLDFYVYLNGQTVKVYGYLYTPHVKIIGGALQANDGQYFTYFGYETNIDNPNGTIYLRRIKKDDDNNVENISNKKMTGSEFLNDIGNIALMYMMGFEDGSSTIKDPIQEALNGSSSSSDGSSPIYIEKVFTGNEFSYQKDSGGNPSWTNIALDLGGFNIDSIKGKVSLSLYGNSAANVLNKVSANGEVILASIINCKIESGTFILDNNCDGKADDTALAAWADSWHNKQGDDEKRFDAFKDAVSSDFKESAGTFAGTYVGTDHKGNTIRLIVSSSGSLDLKKKNGNSWGNYFDYCNPCVIGKKNGPKIEWAKQFDWLEGYFTIKVTGRDNYWKLDETVTLKFVRDSFGVWKESGNAFTYSK